MHETKLHGRTSFPYIVYRGNLPQYLQAYPPHWHDEMEIITISGGSGVVTVQSKRYEVKAGDLILIQPQLIHSISQMKNTPMEYFNILFRFSLLGTPGDACYDKYLKPIYEQAKKVPVYLPKSDPLNQLLRPYIDDLTENRRARYTTHELMVKSDLFAVLCHIQPFCCDANEADRSLHTTCRKLKKVLLYVQENYANPITVDQAADLSGFSASHFAKLFRKLTGTSFTQYLKELRLKIAADQLRQTNVKIIEVAEAAGFDNHSYFTRSFAAKYGMTPSKYRKAFASTDMR